MARNILQINLKDGDNNSLILGDFLRKGKITTRTIEALSSFYMSIAIAECTQSTKAQRDAALHECLSLLGNQMTHLMNYHYRLDGTVVAPGSLSTVMVNGGVGWQSPPLG